MTKKSWGSVSGLAACRFPMSVGRYVRLTRPILDKWLPFLGTLRGFRNLTPASLFVLRGHTFLKP